MNDYDFLNLSPTEFQNLVRDLLQAERKVLIESFADGPDGGTDLRYRKENDELVIIQCKRIKTWKSLYAKLKIEVEKVSRLNPDEYVVATTLDLTEAQITKIKELFGSYIVRTSDVIGNKTINNLLRIHDRFEKIYYKLWITNTSILGRIVNSRVYNQSSFKKEAIIELSSLFVQNDSFNEALELLSNNHFVLISGMPGIGKTTLCNMLVYYLLAGDFEEFVYLSGSINEAISIDNWSKKTVFLFDDFLGSNFQVKNIHTNEDRQMFEFITQIKKSTKLVLILSTREYILNQAKEAFERFSDGLFSESKFILDLGKYTAIIKAEIFHNHLYIYQIPAAYIKSLLDDDDFMKLIYHPNFNPRVIETIVDKGEWKTIPPGDFFRVFKQSFDNPESIWLRIYENHISVLSRCGLAILATLSTTIYLKDFESALTEFAKIHGTRYGILANSFEIKSSLRELERTFISLDQDVDGKTGIGFQNPSIRDFLIGYLGKPANRSLLKDVFSSAVLLEQLTSVVGPLISENPTDEFLFLIGNKIQLDAELVHFVKDKIVKDYGSLKPAELSQYAVEGKSGFRRYYLHDDTFCKLNLLMEDVLYNSKTDRYHQFIVQELQANLDFRRLNYFERNAFISLFEKLYEFLHFDPAKLVYAFAEDIRYISDFLLLSRLEEIIPDSIKKLKDDKKMIGSRYQTVVDSMLREKEVSQYSISELIKVGEKYSIDVTSDLKILSMKAKTYSKSTGDILTLIPLEPLSPGMESVDEEKTAVRQIFARLKDRDE